MAMNSATGKARTRSTHPFTRARNAHRKVLSPLLRVLREQFGNMTLDHIGHLSGIELSHVSRVLSGKTASPNWVDLTRLLVAAGISPNQAAQACGLYQPNAHIAPSGQEEAVLTLDDDADEMVNIRVVRAALVLDHTVDIRIVRLVRVLTSEALGDQSRASLLRHIEAIVDSEVEG